MTTAALFIAGLAIGVLTWASLLALTHLLIVRATRKRDARAAQLNRRIRRHVTHRAFP